MQAEEGGAVVDTQIPAEVWNAIPHAERKKINEEIQQYKANKRMKASEVAYVPQAINLQQDGTRSLSSSTSTSDNAGSRMVSEQNNNYNNSICWKVG